MPLRLSAAEMTTAATSVKSVLSSATTRRWVDKRVTSSQLAAMCMDFISANARIGSVKTSDKGDLAQRAIMAPFPNRRKMKTVCTYITDTQAFPVS